MITYLVVFQRNPETHPIVLYMTELEENANRLLRFFKSEYGERVKIVTLPVNNSD